jgi:hypothetical protein
MGQYRMLSGQLPDERRPVGRGMLIFFGDVWQSFTVNLTFQFRLVSQGEVHVVARNLLNPRLKNKCVETVELSAGRSALMFGWPVGEGGSSICQRKWNGLPAGDMGGKDGTDHFCDGAAVVLIAQGEPLLLNSCDQISS